jgi:tRNA threonylcarbamoyl adenosine modification protein YeaZ
MPSLLMSLLGISCDLNGVEISAALFENEGNVEPSLFVAARQEGQGSSSDAALSLVDEVLGNFSRSAPSALKALGARPMDWLGGVVFNAGPGGFTAVRAACAVAQGLGFGWSKQVAAISSLEAWAESVGIDRIARLGLEKPEEILVLLDARMGELYAGHFQLSIDSSQIVRLDLLAEAVLGPDLMPAWIQANRASPIPLLNHHPAGCERMVQWHTSATASWFCGDVQRSFPALAKQLESQGWCAAEHCDAQEPRLASKSLLRRAFASRAYAFQSPSLVGPRYVRNKVALNSNEQQALRDRHRLKAQLALPE